MTDFRKNIRWAVAVMALGWLGQAGAQAAPQIVDRDSDGLIEINNLDDLNEIRRNLTGQMLRGSSAGCPSYGCNGFELTRDLDFDTNGNGSLDAGDWNVGRSWTPIQGTTKDVPLEENRFRATFNGNGHAIRNMRLRKITSVLDYGLFGVLTDAYVYDLRLSRVDANVFGDSNYQVGGLAGRAHPGSWIEGVAVDGTVVSDSRSELGGLIGQILETGIVQCSFSGQVAHTGANDASPNVGGLIGEAQSSTILGSHAKGRVSGPQAAGLVESLTSTGIRFSYANADVVGVNSAAGLVNRANYQTGGIATEIQSDPEYFTVHDAYALGSVNSGSSAGAGFIGNLTLYDGVTVTIRNSYAKNLITNTANGSQSANLVQVLNGSGLVATGNYWVKDPAGAILPANLTHTANSPLINSGQLLADMQCARDGISNGCAAPLLFQNWYVGTWDFGTTSELPALRMLVDHRWVSGDSPNATGDYESISALRTKFPDDTCDTPLLLYAKEKNSPYVFSARGGAPADEVFETFSGTQGLVCKNTHQADGACNNYQVRYLCDETPAAGTVRWTPYTSRDSPVSGEGDDESIPSAPPVCNAGTPVGIEARVVGGGPAFRRGPPRKLATFSATKGLKCLNADGTCKDFQVRMMCSVLGDR